MLRHFAVAGTPSPKARARTTKQGHAYTPKPTQLAEAKVLDAYLRKYEDEPPMEGPLSLTVLASFSVPKSWSRKRREEAAWHTSRPDLDNLVKLVTDALNGAAYADDSQIALVTARKVYSDDASMDVWLVPIDRDDL